MQGRSRNRCGGLSAIRREFFPRRKGRHALFPGAMPHRALRGGGLPPGCLEHFRSRGAARFERSPNSASGRGRERLEPGCIGANPLSGTRSSSHRSRGPKTRGAYAHHGGALRNRGLHVVAHADGECVEIEPVRLQRVEELAHPPVGAALRIEVVLGTGNRHQSAQAKPGQGQQSAARDRRRLSGGTPDLDSSALMLTWMHTSSGRAPVGRCALRRTAMRSRSTLCTQSKRAAMSRVLLACRWPMKCQVSEKLRQGIELAERVLELILSEVPLPRLESLPYRFGALRLAHREKPDAALGAAPAAFELDGSGLRRAYRVDSAIGGQRAGRCPKRRVAVSEDCVRPRPAMSAAQRRGVGSRSGDCASRPSQEIVHA